MSWIFSFLLACYAAVRLVLWLRGQLRWLSVRRTLPQPPPPVDPPAHLSPGLAALFTASRDLRAQLILARHELSAVQVTDPDAPLGRVRSGRYRRALMESWRLVHAWLRSVAALETCDRLVLDERAPPSNHPSNHADARIAGLIETLRPQWRAVSRARALDPFALDDLLRVERVLTRIDDELLAVEHGLARDGEDPYRDRFRAGRAAVSAGA